MADRGTVVRTMIAGSGSRGWSFGHITVKLSLAGSARQVSITTPVPLRFSGLLSTSAYFISSFISTAAPASSVYPVTVLYLAQFLSIFSVRRCPIAKYTFLQLTDRQYGWIVFDIECLPEICFEDSCGK